MSPHLDDAVFSCGGTLSRLSTSGWRVVVATFFTRSVSDPSGFALACQLDKGLDADVDYMALRRAEDTAAMAELGCEHEWLNFLEAPHRGYGSAAALFGTPRRDDDVLPALRDAIGVLLGRHRPTLVLGPQAIGGHVDHVQVVHALEDIEAKVPTSWWEDFPYVESDRHPSRPFPKRFEALDLQVVDLRDTELRAKKAACLAYASQIDFQFGGPRALQTRLMDRPASERFRGAAIG